MNRSTLLAASALLLLGACSDDDSSGQTPDSGLNSMLDAGDPTNVGESPDLVDYACADDAWVQPECAEPTVELELENKGATHIDEPEVITYDVTPPASGNHRPQWARWGEYDFLPQQRWLHNLEHGGIAFLYHPCAPAELIDGLRDFIDTVPADDGGAFRYVLTPYPDLPTTIAVVAWQNRLTAECIDETEIRDFIDRTYRQAPEDIGVDGRYDYLWQNY